MCECDQECQECPNVKYERDGMPIEVDIERGMKDGQVGDACKAESLGFVSTCCTASGLNYERDLEPSEVHVERGMKDGQVGDECKAEGFAAMALNARKTERQCEPMGLCQGRCSLR